jgi:uncharacterized protein (DUF1786 family)
VSKFSPEERQKRAARMRAMQKSGKVNGLYGKFLGGRPRRGETKEQALQRRRAALDAAIALGRQPEPVTAVESVRSAPEPSDAQQQADRAFQKGQPTGRYRSEGWRSS